MLRLRNWTLPLLAVAIALSFTAARAIAEDAKTDTGTVSGTVTGADDKPVSGVLVRLLHPMAHGEKKAEKQAAKADKPVPVATATTDSDGKYEMKDVPVGDYVLQAQAKGQGSAHEKVSVTKGETAKTDLKLAHNSKGGASSGTGDTKPTDKPADPK